MTPNNTTLSGTAGGTFLSIGPNLNSDDFLRTVILAVIGALVSFVVSVLLKWLLARRKN